MARGDDSTSAHRPSRSAGVSCTYGNRTLRAWASGRPNTVVAADIEKNTTAS